MQHEVEPLLPLCQCSSTSKFCSVKCNYAIDHHKFGLVLFYRISKVLYYHFQMARLSLVCCLARSISALFVVILKLHANVMSTFCKSLDNTTSLSLIILFVRVGIIGRRCQVSIPKKLELGVLSGYPQPQPFQPNQLWKPNPLWKGKAIAWWVATSGPDANSITATTIAIALRVIVVFEFIASISTHFDYKYNLIYSTNVLQICQYILYLH